MWQVTSEASLKYNRESQDNSREREKSQGKGGKEWFSKKY